MKNNTEKRYIAFLRGINVGRHTIKMKTLRNIFVELNFSNVRSYIQSGNIFFTTEEKNKTPTELFVVWHLKNGRPSNAYDLIEKKLGVPTTTRFWYTIGRILLAAQKS